MIGFCLSLPLHSKRICSIARLGCYTDNLTSPIDPDKRHILFGEPSKHVKRDAARAIENNDPIRDRRLTFEEPIGFLFLGIMGEASSANRRVSLSHDVVHAGARAKLTENLASAQARLQAMAQRRIQGVCHATLQRVTCEKLDLIQQISLERHKGPGLGVKIATLNRQVYGDP